MAHSVILGIFSTKEKVETAVAEMQRESFRNADISVLFRCNEGTEDFASGALGSLADIGVLAKPGLGPLIAAGPIMSLLNDANAGAPIGGLAGALIRMGIPQHVARRYAGRIERGCNGGSGYRSSICAAELRSDQEGRQEVCREDRR